MMAHLEKLIKSLAYMLIVQLTIAQILSKSIDAAPQR
jgi:hypothetical protein